MNCNFFVTNCSYYTSTKKDWHLAQCIFHTINTDINTRSNSFRPLELQDSHEIFSPCNLWSSHQLPSKPILISLTHRQPTSCRWARWVRAARALNGRSSALHFLPGRGQQMMVVAIMIWLNPSYNFFATYFLLFRCANSISWFKALTGSVTNTSAGASTKIISLNTFP